MKCSYWRVTPLVWALSCLACCLLALVGCEGEPQGGPGTGGSGGSAGAGGGGGSVMPPEVVETTGGLVRGLRENGVIGFTGIPYAAAPEGDLRFAPPQPRTWTGTLDVSARPSLTSTRCPQRLPVLGDAIDEDCLVATVHVPDPVTPGTATLLWIHGGGFTVGEGIQAGAGTSGHILAGDNDLIVVSFNYRLSALGFLAHPALSAGSEDGVSGNYGFLDTLAALRWVKDNIEAFGGDPNKITIAGQSAGGALVCLLLASEEARGLFSGAVIQSSTCSTSRTLDDGHVRGAAYAEAVGCDQADDVAQCLRDVPVQTIVDLQFGGGGTLGGGGWGPLIDGVVIKDALPGAIEDGNYNTDIPIIYGITADEGNTGPLLADASDDIDNTDEAYRAALEEYYASRGYADGEIDVDVIMAAYPRSAFEGRFNNPENGVEFSAAFWALTAVKSDEGIGCTARNLFSVFAEHGETYVYLFAYPDSIFPLQGNGYGAFHSSETPYLFGIHAESLLGTVFTPDEEVLYAEMSSYWVRFATDGKPGSNGTVEWPQYLGPVEDDSTTDLALRIDRTMEVLEGPKAVRCAALQAARVP